ncbi:MAG: 30S ribosomal protein S21 [Rickettsiaceae bacterium]|nr:30S ribosomal protein S21 [Rickettsiaceae bacterium]
MSVHVVGNNVEKARNDLKRKMQRELIFRCLKICRFNITKSMKKVMDRQESVRRRMKSSRRRSGE